MMDRNGNGKIDQEELDRLPPQMIEGMRSRGMDLKAGMSVDDFRNGATSISRGSSDSNDPRSRGDNGGPPALKPYKQKLPAPIVIEMPQKYKEIDLDFDQQLAFHEWLADRRESLDEFDAIDNNGDGFLTAFELLDYESGGVAGAAMIVMAETQPKLTIVGAPSRSSRGDDRSRDSRGDDRSRDSRGGDAGGSSAQAGQYFGMMDRNQNGRIDQEEWDQSRRVKPMFEQAGIRLTDMNKDEFIKNYEQAAAQSGGGR